jgi:two-component system nitrogen regulation response regulator GlnG
MTKANRKVLILDDDKPFCELFSQFINSQGLTPLVAYDAETALKIIRLESPDVLIADFRMPGRNGLDVLRSAKALDEDLPVILMTGYAEVQGAVEAMKAGAHDYLAKPFLLEDTMRVILRALRERDLKHKLKHMTHEIRQAESLREMMGPSDAVAQLMAEVDLVAQSDFCVLILGESGSGKELVARAIHRASPQSKGAFVAIDCGAIPETLLESELFGHEKGAFTGAVGRKTGKFELARGGTLLLDEISNMPLGSQAKLLRVLQEKSIYRVGGIQPIPIDVRVLVACNQDLEQLAASRSFRRDLFFRLNEFTIKAKPLRERNGDILYLARRFLEITNQELKKRVTGISESAIQALLACDWPGNVRQLRSTIRRAVLLADDVITEKHLDISVPAGGAVSIPSPQVRDTQGGTSLKTILQRNLAVVERQVIGDVLRQTGGNKAAAARLLHIDYKTIHTKVKQYNIETNGGIAYG